MSVISDCRNLLYCALICKSCMTMLPALLTTLPTLFGLYNFAHLFSFPSISSAINRPAITPCVKPSPESPVTMYTLSFP